LALAFLGFATTPAGASAPESGTWVGLAAGRVGDVLWSVKIARPSGAAAGRRGGRRPCLQVGTKKQRGRFDYERSVYQGCIRQSERLEATESPLIVAGAQASLGMRVSLTAVGMVASPAARRIEVTYADGREEMIHLLEPSTSQQERAGLIHFRYAAFAIRGTWKVERVITENASGRTLWDSAKSD
jgi:hypothetical protein